MKIYGYSSNKISDDGLLEMEEISIQSNPVYLKNVASFLNQCADSIEKHENNFMHAHLRDWLADWDESFSDIIVVKK